MSYADFYLTCFVVGLALSVLSFLAGGLRWHIPHLPHGFAHGHVGGHVHVGHLGHGHFGHVGHAPAGVHGPAAGGHAGASVARSLQTAAQVSPFNLMTLTAFMAWFGGTGFLLTRFSSVWFFVGVLFATGVGVTGAAIVFLFMTKILMSTEEAMDPADYEMVGVLGRLSNPIREGGTGELIYSQAGTRRVCGARSDDGTAIDRGSEVVVTRYERGIAYVRSWEDMTGEGSLPPV